MRLAQSTLLTHHTAHLKIEQGHHDVEHNIGKMESHGVQASCQPVVEPEGENSEGAIGLVTGIGPDLRSPEIVLENLQERGAGGIYVLVVQDGFIVIEGKLAPATVDVAERRQEAHQHPDPAVV